MKELYKALQRLPHVEKVEVISAAGSLPRIDIKLRNGTTEKEVKTAALAHGFEVSDARTSRSPIIYLSHPANGFFHILIKQSELANGRFGLQLEEKIDTDLRTRIVNFFSKVGKLN